MLTLFVEPTHTRNREYRCDTCTRTATADPAALTPRDPGSPDVSTNDRHYEQIASTSSDSQRAKKGCVRSTSRSPRMPKLLDTVANVPDAEQSDVLGNPYNGQFVEQLSRVPEGVPRHQGPEEMRRTSRGRTARQAGVGPTALAHEVFATRGSRLSDDGRVAILAGEGIAQRGRRGAQQRVRCRGRPNARQAPARRGRDDVRVGSAHPWVGITSIGRCEKIEDRVQACGVRYRVIAPCADAQQRTEEAAFAVVSEGGLKRGLKRQQLHVEHRGHGAVVRGAHPRLHDVGLADDVWLRAPENTVAVGRGASLLRRVERVTVKQSPHITCGGKLARLLVRQGQPVVQIAAPEEELPARRAGRHNAHAVVGALHAEPHALDELVVLGIAPLRALLPRGQVAAKKGEARASEQQRGRDGSLVARAERPRACCSRAHLEERRERAGGVDQQKHTNELSHRHPLHPLQRRAHALIPSLSERRETRAAQVREGSLEALYLLQADGDEVGAPARV
eukprot:scaffold236653_cov31-Tisochrysis_lutea.AAC.1